MEATATQMKNSFGYYLDKVMNEDCDVVITKNGTKAARLTPYVTDVERYFTVRENALDYTYGGKKVSYEEFMTIYEKSTLRMEYINGEIHLLASASINHQTILGKLYLIFSEYFKGKPCHPYLAPFDVHFKKQNFKDPDVMQPDLLVICDLPKAKNEKDKYTGTPTLVIEILSKSTRSKDMIDKLNTYMLSGVKEYWIVDPKQEKILVYEFKEYSIEQFLVFDRNTTTESLYFNGLMANVNDVFDRI